MDGTLLSAEHLIIMSKVELVDHLRWAAELSVAVQVEPFAEDYAYVGAWKHLVDEEVL